MSLKRLLCIFFSVVAIASAVFIFSNSCFAVEAASTVDAEIMDEPIYTFSLFDYVTFLVLGIALACVYFTSKYRYNQKMINLIFAGCLIAVGTETVQYFSGCMSSMGDVWTDIAGLLTGFITVSVIVILIRLIRIKLNHKIMVNKG